MPFKTSNTTNSKGSKYTIYKIQNEAESDGVSRFKKVRFKTAFESANTANISWEGVPEVGGRAAERSGSHGRRAGRWCGELASGRGYESTERSVNVKEFREMQQAKVMEGLKGEKQNLEINAIFNRKPVKLRENGSDMIY